MAVRTRRAAAKEEEKGNKGKWAAHSGKNATVGFVATLLLLVLLFFSWFRLVGGFVVVAPLPASAPRSSRRMAALSALPSLSPVLLLLASSQNPAALGPLEMRYNNKGGGTTVVMVAAAGGEGAAGGAGVNKGGGEQRRSDDALLAGLEDEVRACVCV